MKLFSTITLFCLAIGIHTVSFADHLSGRLLFTATLNGDQEVPPVATDGMGAGSLFLNEAKDSLCVNITVYGLSGDIAAAHIHEGAMGMNGGVLFDFGPFIEGNNITATITGDDLTPGLLTLALNDMLYINVHTADNPNGEVRGQIMLEKDMAFRAMLDPEQENHEVMSDALGLATFNLSRAGDKVQFYGVFDNLTSEITMAHLHMAPAGEDGPVVVDLGDFLDGNTLTGSFDPTEVEGLLQDMLGGNIYINVHTEDFPAGELRGQVMLENRLSHDAWLDTEQEVPAPMGSEGVGLSFVSLNHTMDTLFYEAQVTMLTGPITGAHFHEGEPGVAGGVLIDLTDDVMGNRISGFVTGTDLSTENMNKFLSGMIYLNVHTEMNAPGEVRGQVYKLAREGYTYSLTGEQEVPEVETDATGNGFVSIDRDQSNVHFMFAFDGLSGPATMAHFHTAPMGENGGVIFDFGPFLDLSMNSGMAAGFWTDMDDMPFGLEDAADFRGGMVYVNVHTEDNPGGEVRGQVVRSSICSDMSLNVFTSRRPDIERLGLFPNPATDRARLDVSSVAQGMYTLTITDMTGRMQNQQQVQVNGNSIDLPLRNLASGVYILNLTNVDAAFGAKLIKQ